MSNQPLVLEGICYALLSAKMEFHPIAHERHNLIWYPETGMPLLEQVSYRPYVKSVVTESPWVIGCYSREHVRVWDTEFHRWEIPRQQTYGASVSSIYCMLGNHQTISAMPYDGGKNIQNLQDELAKSYQVAQGE